MASGLSIADQRKVLYDEEMKCRYLNAITSHDMTEPHCNRTWDNIICWQDTPAGELVSQPCPHYINKFDSRQTVTRYCTENGTWWINPDTNQTWSNYTMCERPFPETDRVSDLIQEHLPGIKLMSIVGYSLSLSTLVFALIIMIYFKRLHCKRNMIHINMFLAFGSRAALLLMKNILLVNDLGFANDVNQTGSKAEFIHEGTHWECKLFFTCISYIIIASLMWLLNEGLYLHLILSVSVFGDKIKIRWFVLLGWGMPIIFVIPWVIVRIILDNVLCWNVHLNGDYFYILHGPMVASCAVNFLLFLNIVRILYTKITASHCPDSKTVRYRKLAKSTLILIPLFATYYMGFIWLPDDKSMVELFKLYVEMIFNSTQGFLVALLFCFMNHEVQYEIRKKWQRRSWANNYSPSRKFQSHGYLSHRSEAHNDIIDRRNTLTTKVNFNMTDLSNKKQTPIVHSTPAEVNVSSPQLPHYDVFEVHSQHSDEAEDPFLACDAEDENQVPLFLVNENFSESYSKPCQELTDDYKSRASERRPNYNGCVDGDAGNNKESDNAVSNGKGDNLRNITVSFNDTNSTVMSHGSNSRPDSFQEGLSTQYNLGNSEGQNGDCGSNCMNHVSKDSDGDILCPTNNVVIVK